MLLFIIKTALRNFFSQKQNAFIIILSLTISFAFSNILITFISYEINTDSFHENNERTYRLFSDDPFEQGKKLRYIQREVGQFLSDHFPEVEKVCRVATLRRKGNTLSVGDKNIPDQMILKTDTTFFEFFNFPLLEGNRAEAITTDGIVLMESLAKKLWEAPPYIGRTIDLSNGDEVKTMIVTAVLKDFQENTQFKFDALVSVKEPTGGSIFLMLNENSNSAELEKKMNQNKAMPSLIAPGESKYELEPFRESYYNASGIQAHDRYRNKQLIIICWVVVFLLSFSSSFNFINLYVVSLLTRRKEIGVKRVFGATKANMIFSIGVEVGMFVLFSILLSLVLTYYLLPLFNASLNTQLSFSYFAYIKVLSIVIASVLCLALLITFYLVIFIWRLNPLGLINDKLAHKVKANQLMFTVQFFISVSLVISSFVVISQMQFIKNTPLGFNKHLLQLYLPTNDQKAKLHVLKEQLLNYPEFSNASVTSGNPISGNAIVRYELPDKSIYAPFLLIGDESLAKTMGLTIIKGQNLNPQNPSGKLVNETFVRFFDMKDPIGQAIPGTKDYILGVVNDFNCVSLKQEIPPYIISYSEGQNFLLIDVAAAKLEKIIPLVAKEWSQIYPNEPFQYKLIEDELLAKHKEDTYLFRMVISFTIASLLISCFGLFGIASFTHSRRTKEIGIRKVLGASFANILMMVWKDYVKLISISFIVAVPIVNYFLDEWLKEFAYRIELSWWLYLIPGLFVVLMTLLTISGQSIKAANTNPVDSLKVE